MGLRRLACTAAAAIVAAGLSVAPSPASAAPPPPPTGLQPASGEQSSTPTLTWEPVAKAVSYEVQVDDDPTFGSPTSGTSGSRHYVPTTHLRPGAQSWRVRAVTVDRQVSGWSEVATFDVGKVDQPVDLVPDGAEVRQPDAPLLSWAPVRGATSYLVQVDREDDFVGAFEYDTAVTSLVVEDALPAADDGTPYVWHVKAVKAGGLESAWSDTASFEAYPLDRPTITSPDSSPTNTVTDVVLDWEPVPGAHYYQLEVSTDDDFATSTLVDERNRVLGTRYSPATTYDNNQYYWRVRAVDTGGNPTSWSDVGQFRRAWPDRPTPIWPEDGTDVADDLFLQWSPVPHATQYQVQMGSDPNFSPGTFEACQLAGTTYTPGMFRINEETGTRLIGEHERCHPTPGTRTYWRVRPLDLPFNRPGAGAPGVAGLFSPARSFVYRPDRDTVGPVSPADGATVDVPTLSWDPARWAEQYRITVRNASGTAVVNNISTRATSYTPVTSARMTPGAGPYTWSLTAVGADGRTASLVQQRSFTLSGSVPTTGATPLTVLSASEDDAPTRRAPSMTWEPVPGAAYYKIQAGPDGSGAWWTSVSGDLLDTKLYWPAVTDTHTWFAAPGRYRWQVTAYDAGNAVIARSDEAVFTIAALDVVTGLEIALDGTTLLDGDGTTACAVDGSGDCEVDAPATPVVSWEPVPGAAGYIVYVSEDEQLTNLVEPVTSFPATTNTFWAPTTAQRSSALAESEAGASYYVHVRACGSMTGRLACGPPPRSQSPSLATLRFRKTSPPAELVSPVDQAQVDAGEVTLDWEDYRDTNAAAAWSDTGEASTQSAQWYRVQVDDDPRFASPEEETVDQSTFTAVIDLYPEGTLHWRVQAIDAEGNDLAWSETRTFVKSTPPPAGLRPAEDATAPTTPVFSWDAQASTGSYDLQLYANGDRTFSSPNRVFDVRVEQAAYAWSQRVPASDKPYVWRVRRIDAADNPGPWSVVRELVVEEARPSTTGPSDGSFVEAEDLLLSWGAVDGASSYEVTLQPAAGTAASPARTVATAWAPAKRLADGEWRWQVWAVDPDGELVGRSAWSSFVVDEDGPTVVKRTPSSTAKPRSTFTATFSEPARKVSTTTMQLLLDGRKGNLPAKVTTSADGLKATLKPKKRLKKGQRYEITLSRRITDDHGNPLERTTWSVYVS